jgi:hypothetical protein
MQARTLTQQDILMSRSDYVLTNSDREYAQRHGLSAEDMLAFIEDVFIEQENKVEMLRMESNRQEQWQTE